MRAKKLFSRLAWAYVAFLLVSGAAQLLLGAVLAVVFAGRLESENYMGLMMLLSQLCMYGAGFPVFCLIIRKIPSWHLAGGRNMSFGTLLLGLIACLGTGYIGNMIGTILMAVWDLAFGTSSVNPVVDAVYEMNLGMTVLSTVIVAPIMEELMFRKLMIDRLIPYGQKFAVVVSGISFGLFHGNFFQFFYACMLGMILAYFYSSTGKLRYSIFLHMCLNAFGGVLPLLLNRAVEQGSMLGYIASAFFSVWMIVTMVYAVVMAFLFIPKLSWTRAWAETPGYSAAAGLFSSPGVWAFLIVNIASFVMY